MNTPNIPKFKTSLKIKKRASNPAGGHQTPLYITVPNYGATPTAAKETCTYLDTLEQLRNV